ncbi:2-acylglycerol O-acyltransferase 2-A-like [Plodia interpunctella]|uniref:2-acylglycerol O-acyltransferase 2-A-like n=1 Tax=Plodia interpunctella TaxID=58824 RepID=UPI0023686BB4|nr:2-acylglycerol O-acyltransferase 2-A-like [Plodia interpunctella]
MDLFRSLSDILGIQWAPLHVPLERRLQTLAVFCWFHFMTSFGVFSSIYLFIKLLYSSYWYLAIAYSVWMLYDINTGQRGGRPRDWVRNWSWWRYHCNYFPTKMIKTAELDPSKNYLLACIPHGVICMGLFPVLAANVLEFGKHFPGIRRGFATLPLYFYVPFFREFAMAIGGTIASEESIVYSLDSKRYKGNAVAVIVGGAKEAAESHPGQYNTILRQRKGFIRCAIKSGASLVPTITFGEVDLYDPVKKPEGTFARKCQDMVYKLTGINPLFPKARGLLQYSYGSVPYRKPLFVVIGAPMEVKKNHEPTPEEVDAVHAQFIDEMVDLFEREKVHYVENHENVKLNLL